MSNNPNAIEKTLIIMNAFTQSPFEYTAKELSDKLDISKSTVHRILNILEENNYVKKTYDKTKYTVGYGSYRVGMQYAKRQDVYYDIREIVDSISDATKQQVGYTVLEGEAVVSIYESTFYNNTVTYMPGEIYTINCGVYGKVLMSFSHSIDKLKTLVPTLDLKQITPNAITDHDKLLEEYLLINERGYAESDGEFIEGTIGIGAPTFYSNGKLHGCVGLSGINTETFRNNKQYYIDEVLKGAKKISMLLK